MFLDAYKIKEKQIKTGKLKNKNVYAIFSPLKIGLLVPKLTKQAAPKPRVPQSSGDQMSVKNAFFLSPASVSSLKA